METPTQLSISISFDQLKKLIMQLSKQERAELVSSLTEEDSDDFTKEEVLQALKADYTALKKGALKTRPLKKRTG